MVGYHENKAAVQRRLRRIEGQVRGLQRMVDEDVYCIDVLTQVSATTRAIILPVPGIVSVDPERFTIHLERAAAAKFAATISGVSPDFVEYA